MTVESTAAVAHAAHAPFAIEPIALDDPRGGEVLVRIAGVGLCHTDLVARDRLIPIPLPAVLGHEGAGIVEAVGPGVSKVRPGDRVVLAFASCGHCASCDADLPSYCRDFPALNFAGTRPDGSSAIRQAGAPISGHFFGQSSFAAHAIAQERNVVKVEDDDLPLDILGPLGCGLQTGAGGVMRSLACPPGSTIAIFGAGPVGLAAVMAARIQECGTIIVVEPMAQRRELALSLGATHAIDPAKGNVSDAIRAILPDGVQFAFETSGREDVIETALAALASHGLLGLVGVPPRADSTLAINLVAFITYGHRIQGIIEGDSDPDSFIPELIAHHRAGRFPFDRLVQRFPLSEINAAVEAQARGECVKAVLIP